MPQQQMQPMMPGTMWGAAPNQMNSVQWANPMNQWQQQGNKGYWLLGERDENSNKNISHTINDYSRYANLSTPPPGFQRDHCTSKTYSDQCLT